VAEAIQAIEEGAVAHPVPQMPGVVEPLLRQEDAGDGGLGVGAVDEIDVAAEDAALHAVGPDQVVGHQQELFPLQPVVVLGDDAGPLGEAAGLRVARQDQVPHGHEVRLAAAETAVEVGRLAGAAADGIADAVEGLVEAPHQLGGEDVLAERPSGIDDAFREAEDEVTFRNVLGDVAQRAEQRPGPCPRDGHVHACGAVVCRPRPRAGRAGGGQARTGSTVRPFWRASSCTKPSSSSPIATPYAAS
jgi:hypothetical protein